MQSGLKIECVVAKPLDRKEDLIQWTITIQSVLMQEDLWSLVDGTERKPLQSEGATYSFCQSWTERNERAVGIIWGALGRFFEGPNFNEIWGIVAYDEDSDKEVTTAHQLWSEIWVTVDELEWLSDVKQKSAAALRTFEAAQEASCSDDIFLKKLGTWITSIHVLKLLQTGLKPSTCPGLDTVTMSIMWGDICERVPKYILEDTSVEIKTLQVPDLFDSLEESCRAECRQRGLPGLESSDTNPDGDSITPPTLEEDISQLKMHCIKALDPNDDFVNWFRQMQIFLLQKGLCSITNGREARPSDLSSNLSDQEHWDNRNRDAKRFILSALGEKATMRLLLELRHRRDMLALDLLIKIIELYGCPQGETLKYRFKDFLLEMDAYYHLKKTNALNEEAWKKVWSSTSDALWIITLFRCSTNFFYDTWEVSTPESSLIKETRRVIRECEIVRFKEVFDILDNYCHGTGDTVSDPEVTMKESTETLVIGNALQEEEDWDMMDGATRTSTTP